MLYVQGSGGRGQGSGARGQRSGARGGRDSMNCLKGKAESKAKPGRFKCKKCKAVSKKKNHLCDPKKIKE
jgi:hypothetical protein